MDIRALHSELESFFPKMVEIRRDLHRHPELSFQEERTPRIIADFLKELGLEVRTKVGGRGVVGILKGKKEGKTVALRADFDALPIQDEKDVPYKSLVPGVMHACGHDGHTAILLGVASALSRHQASLEGNVVFIHQFAEELAPGGAIPMIEDHCLQGVDVIFATHLQSTLPVGQVFFREGYSHASADKFEIIVTGQGGHGSAPHETVDPLLTASQLVVNLQHIISRSVDPVKPAVLSVGSFQSGEAFNVIPIMAKLSGTVRTYDSDVRDLIEQQIERIAVATCKVTGASCEINYERGYDAVWNHPKETRYIKQISREIVGTGNVKERPPIMGSEDFSYYLKKVPGAFFFTGARLSDENKVFPHHHPCFDFDERAMLIAAKILASAAVNANKEIE